MDLNIFKKYLNLDVRDEIYIDFSDNKHGYLPPIWDYNNDNHRLKHNEYFANINKNAFHKNQKKRHINLQSI